ncbi:MAG: TIR domain-containing protein, partial [Chloroflexi bacterium]|nr:TIR domain-containing protein [Chloroflexota bacterium]
MPLKEPVTIFYGYAHSDEDTEVKRKLDKHLRPLSELPIVHWDDCEVLPGEEWAIEIKKNLNAADIILLLISSDFMASKYCCQEMETALARHNRGEAHVIPVILRPVDWDDAPFSNLQALPREGKAITRWDNKDDACVDVKRGIRKAVDGVQGIRQAKKYRDRANEQFLRGHYENAIEYYNEALHVFPQNPSFNQNKAGIQQDIAEVLLKLNKAQEALEAYEIAIQLDPDNVLLYSRKGDILFEQKQFPEALVAYEIALRKSLNDPALYQKKG